MLLVFVVASALSRGDKPADAHGAVFSQQISGDDVQRRAAQLVDERTVGSVDAWARGRVD